MRTRLTIVFTALTLCLTAACGEEPQAREFGYTPRSLEGTDIDGSFTLDRDGRFFFDEHAVEAFDYFLTADEELGPNELHAWVEAEIKLRVPAGQRQDVIDAWHAYLIYRGEAAAALADTQASKADVEQRLLAALDEQLGDAPIAALERERITRAFALSRALELSGEDRELALAQLGADDTELEGDALAFLAGRRAVELAKASGASADQVHAIRSAQYGEEAADRLADLDAERAAWKARVEELEAARAELRESFVGSPDALAQAIAELEAERFSAAELRRVRALDELDRG